MAYATIRDKIKTYMLTVSNVGNVHSYVRWHKDMPAMLTLYKVTTPTAQIRFWDISRIKTVETAQVSKANTRRHTFRVRGFMSLDDAAASELTFQALIEAVCDKFRSLPTFGGDAVDSDPIQVNSVGHVEVGNVLCHFCECSLQVDDDIPWQES